MIIKNSDGMLKTRYILKFFIIAILFIVPHSLFSQEHYLGVKGGYGISSASFDPYMGDGKSVSGIDYGIAYKLYAGKRTNMGIGTQVEFNFTQTGYQLVDTIFTGRAVELPAMAQGFLRFGGFRMFVDAGVFISYVTSLDVEKPDGLGNTHTEAYSFTERDKKFDYGILGGGGLAFQLKKVELQVEARYQFGFGYMMKPRYKEEPTIFSHRSRLAFAFTLFYNL